MSQLYNLETIAEQQKIKVVYRSAGAMNINGASIPIFNIVGGRVIIREIVGEIVVASGTNLFLQYTQTIGNTTTICDMFDIEKLEAGTLLNIRGIDPIFMYDVRRVTKHVAGNLILPIGAIEVVNSAAEVIIAWTVYYVSFDDGAYITAA